MQFGTYSSWVICVILCYHILWLSILSSILSNSELLLSVLTAWKPRGPPLISVALSEFYSFLLMCPFFLSISSDLPLTNCVILDKLFTHSGYQFKKIFINKSCWTWTMTKCLYYFLHDLLAATLIYNGCLLTECLFGVETHILRAEILGQWTEALCRNYNIHQWQ